MTSVLTLILAALMAFTATGESPIELTIQSRYVSLTVDVLTGARVSSLRFNGVEFLATERDSRNVTWGSTVWPSPQSDWDWPPPPSIDSEPYNVMEHSDRIIELESQSADYSDIRVSKRFEFVNETTLGVTYTFANTGQDTIHAGIWENTRVELTGYVSWGTGEYLGEVRKLKEERDRSLFDLTGHETADKLFIRSYSGWLSYQREDVVFTKYFPSIDREDVPPGHAPIELYYDPHRLFAELEVHGPYCEIMPGESLEFKLMWSFNRGR